MYFVIVKNKLYNFVFYISKKLQQKVTPLYQGVLAAIPIISQQ